MNKVKEEKNKGITLISLVLSIIILLILAGVSLSLVVGETGIVERASKTKNVTETAELQEKIKMAAMAAQVEGLGTIPSIDVLKSELDSAIGTDYTIEETEKGWTVIANKSAFNIDRNGGTEETEYFDSEEWDKNAVSEDCFYWASDTEGTEGYGTVIGYKAKIDSYTLLRYPSRCDKITFLNGNFEDGTKDNESRVFTNNILKIEIPGTVKTINLQNDSTTTFKNLEEIVWGYGITDIRGVKGTDKLKKVSIPNSVTTIQSDTFSGCSGLAEIDIPSSVTQIGSFAFEGCSGLTKIIIPKSVTSIDRYAFSWCTNLNSITIPNGITYIGDLAFENCNSLKEIILPSSVNILGHQIFNGCTNMEKVFVSKDIVTIMGGNYNSGPFANLSSLQIYTDAITSQSGWTGNWNGGCTVHYGVSLEEFNNL